MEAARCDLCGKPVSSWLEVCDKLNVCTDCAASVTLASLVGAGYAVMKPDTFQMDGDTLVTKDSPDMILDYQKAKQQLNTAYGMHTNNGYKMPELVEDEVKPLSSDAKRNFIGSILKSGEIPEEPIGRGDISFTLKQSYDWTIEEIVQYIKDLGFATEKTFFTHINALTEGGYTEETSYALILRNRYEEKTVCDEIGTHYNALEGQTPEEAIKLFIESEKAFEEEHPEYKFGTPEQKAMLAEDAKRDTLVTKGFYSGSDPYVDTDSFKETDTGMDMSRLEPDKSYAD